MQSMKFTVETDRIIRTWPRIERYQNSTLRYTPPVDFPAFWASVNGRPKIIRCWITLDEVWDYRTDTFNWNYQIGVNKYEGDDNHYSYDWPSTRPSQTRFEDYLKSYTAMADEAMLNLRRYERETADGILSYEKYEEVCEKVIEHCRLLCPNIKYIEVSNESEIKPFGGITVTQYMPLYDCICRAVNRINERHGWSLQVGGTAMTGGWYYRIWRDYLEALAKDETPEKRIDFYSMHTYNPDHNQLAQMYNLHKAAVAELGLPDVPMFFDEYGTCRATGVLTDSLKNASETLTGLLRGADLNGMFIFPWCTFHNPELQMSYTQYLRLPDNTYAPTPNGQAMTVLHGMLDHELKLTGNAHFRVRATGGDGKVYLIVTNPSDEPLLVNCTLTGLMPGKSTVEMCQVDAVQNNAVTSPPCKELAVTEMRELAVTEDGAAIVYELPPYAFAGWLIKSC
ncbi:MAG: hypothetical protein SCM11_08095 [Bacillota bacterium]|nr:hypothetical protein [Bacillota bacterium]